MQDFWTTHSTALYQAGLIGSLMLACLLETVAPARTTSRNPFLRWFNNLLLGAVNYIVLIALAPLVYLAIVAPFGLRDTGLLHRFDVPPWLALVILFLALELVGYWFHRASHAVPSLWRLHAVHHSDTELDFTTAHRHHTLEVVIGTLVSLPVLLVLAPDVWVLVAYNALQSLIVALNHANLSFGPFLNKLLKWWIVTPDFHRLHHSAEQRYTDSHYGTLSPLYDHLFGTATPLADAPSQSMPLGLGYFREPRDGRIDRMLALPFSWRRNDAGARKA